MHDMLCVDNRERRLEKKINQNIQKNNYAYLYPKKDMNKSSLCLYVLHISSSCMQNTNAHAQFNTHPSTQISFLVVGGVVWWGR